MKQNIFGGLLSIFFIALIGIGSEHEKVNRMKNDIEILKEAGFKVIVKNGECIAQTSKGWRSCDKLMDAIRY